MDVKNYDSQGATFLTVRHLLVTESEVGLRLDRFLKDHLHHVPFSLIQRLLRTGQVRVNSGRVRGNRRLLLGDKVRLPPIHTGPPQGAKVPHEGLVLEVSTRILWQDDHLLILNKPEGRVVHGGSGQPWGLVDGVRSWISRQGEKQENEHQPELCHRLDKETSGCLLFALSKVALRGMTAAFRQGVIQKEYITLVRGHPSPEQGVIDQPLQKGVILSGERMVVPDQGGMPARTRYQTTRHFLDASLLSVTLDSGRTHQIRAHFQWLGHPVAGDRKYGDRMFDQRMKKIGLTRMFLHAHRLAFTHPITQKPVEVIAPLDQNLTKIIKLIK